MQQRVQLYMQLQVRTCHHQHQHQAAPRTSHLPVGAALQRQRTVQAGLQLRPDRPLRTGARRLGALQQDPQLQQRPVPLALP
jgi:hypothetical protein